MMKIKDLKPEERPRERLLKNGAKALTTAELLAILLRTGTGKRNVVEVAQEMLSAMEGGLQEISGMSTESLCRFNGIGPDKAATLAAAFELGFRCTAELMNRDHTEIRGPEKVFELMFPKIAGADHEECWVLYLNRSNRLISLERLSSGGLSETTIDLAAIIRKALEKKASAVILTHNHPSGNPAPSRSDVQMTERLKKALAMMDISLIDHVIVSDGCWYSFADEEIRYYGENLQQ